MPLPPRSSGFRQPIVVDADGVIVVGHTRWKAAKRLGLAKVPVHVTKDLTPGDMEEKDIPQIFGLAVLFCVLTAWAIYFWFWLWTRRDK